VTTATARLDDQVQGYLIDLTSSAVAANHITPTGVICAATPIPGRRGIPKTRRSSGETTSRFLFALRKGMSGQRGGRPVGESRGLAPWCGARPDAACRRGVVDVDVARAVKPPTGAVAALPKA
jgi:hypothetical protein